MKIVILIGTPAKETNRIDSVVAELAKELTAQNHRVSTIAIDDLNVKKCIGCFHCWTKHPGRCKFDDDGAALFTEIINADLVIFASPLVMGFTTSILKTVLDRYIVLIHPHITLVNNECHHEKRYEKYPKLGLIVEPEPDTDAEDLEIVGDIYERMALNFHSTIELFETTDKNTKEIADAIDHI